METHDLHFGSEAICILQYLNVFKGQFISEMEIARRADSRERFENEPRWAQASMAQLLELRMIETDGHGHYRLKTPDTNATETKKKFIDPRIRGILERSGQNFDLSNYT